MKQLANVTSFVPTQTLDRVALASGTWATPAPYLSRRQSTASSELRGNDCIYANDGTWSCQPVTREFSGNARERLAA